MTRRTRQERRADAIERAENYRYEDSKAKRKGQSEEKWREETAARLEALKAKRG